MHVRSEVSEGERLQGTRRSLIEEQLCGMENIYVHRAGFELCAMKKKERRPCKFSCLAYSILLKVSGTHRVGLAIE